ncbi:hypothetical protein [Aliiroseovarius sp. YM-037]|uniref:hypothetical protein n=1 Tax=Aliiroseovarius sp. YM-037 TaxID=3341728 RepID=UPI003A7F63CB
MMLLAACGTLGRCGTAKPLDRAAFDALYTPAPAPLEQPLRAYHLGHSLVGRDMPAMLAQLAGDGHSYESQLGWGSPLKAHWEPDEPINGFDVENDHPRYRDAREAVASGDYDALILTEMVEIRDAIKYFDSASYVQKWADAAWSADPDTRVFLYESWHELDDPEGWLERLDLDLTRYWEDEILRPALSGENTKRPIYVIPAGQVFATLVRAVEDRGGVGPIGGREDLFALRDDGTRDNIHFNDLGAYLVALTHYAVLYQRTPVGLPHSLTRADGTPATDPGAEVASLMQEVVWNVVTSYPKTGVQ